MFQEFITYLTIKKSDFEKPYVDQRLIVHNTSTNRKIYLRTGVLYNQIHFFNFTLSIDIKVLT